MVYNKLSRFRHQPQVTDFAGLIARRGGRFSEVPPSSASARTTSCLLERGMDDSELAEVQITGCPGRPIRVSLTGSIDNAQGLIHELRTRDHKFTTGRDAEVIAHAYEEWGEAFVERLWGVFALTVWDERAGILLLARDRIGARSLYYCEVDEGFAFGSHLTALRALVDPPWDIDPRAIDAYLTLRAVPAPLSIFRSVSKLPAAHILKHDCGKAKLTPYWSFNCQQKTRADQREVAETLDGLLRDTLERNGGDECGVMLSAGVDSAIILALLSELRRGPVQTFSFAFAGGFHELAGARRTAQYFGAEHHEFNVEPRIEDALCAVIWRYEEPHGNASALPWHYMTCFLPERVKMVLCGEGADEVFAGRDRHLVVSMAERLHGLSRSHVMVALAGIARFSGSVGKFFKGAALPPLDRHLFWASTFSPAEKAALYSPDFAEHIEVDQARQLLACLLPLSAHPLDQAFAVDLGLWVPEVLTITLGIEGVQVRTPFLDHRIVELAASLPPSWKVGWGKSKRFLREAYVHRLPPWLSSSRRRGGAKIPVGPLLRGELRTWLEEYVLSPTAMDRGYFEPTAVRRLVDEHLQGRADHGARLWTLLMLELWHRQWLDR
jgi:asparagine synthase (glutamine-hydrolysing)